MIGLTVFISLIYVSVLFHFLRFFWHYTVCSESLHLAFFFLNWGREVDMYCAMG
jgi:hypothetical protein